MFLPWDFLVCKEDKTAGKLLSTTQEIELNFIVAEKQQAQEYKKRSLEGSCGVVELESRSLKHKRELLISLAGYEPSHCSTC